MFFVDKSATLNLQVKFQGSFKMQGISSRQFPIKGSPFMVFFVVIPPNVHQFLPAIDTFLGDLRGSLSVEWLSHWLGETMTIEATKQLHLMSSWCLAGW